MAVPKKKKSVSWKRHKLQCLNKKICIYKFNNLTKKSISNFFETKNLYKFQF